MANNLPKIEWYSTYHVTLIKSWLVQKQTALGQTTTGKEISNPFMAGSLPKTIVTTFIQFWNTVVIKQIIDVTRLQALVDKKKVVITEAAIREVLRLDDAEGVDCLPNEEIFAELACMGDDAQEPSIPSLTLGTPPPQQPQDLPSTSQVQPTPPQSPQPQPQPQPQAQQHAADFPISLLQEALDACDSLTRRVEHLEYDKVAQALEITKLKRRVKKLEKGNRVKVLKLRRLKKGRIIDEMDKNDVVALMDDKEEHNKEEMAKVIKDDQVQGRQAESQAKIYKIDLDHASKVLKVVTAASETVTAASTTIFAAKPQVTAATITAAPSKDKGKGIMVEEPKPLKKKQQVEMDEEYARKLHAELNKDIDWDTTIDHVKQKAKELDYFKGMSYDDIRPIFEGKFKSNIEFLLKTKEQMEEDENRVIQSINKTPTQKAAKRRKLNEEVEDLKRHLEIVPDEDDDVYTEATPLARKVPIVDYEIIHLNNKPHYKIIRADKTHWFAAKQKLMLLDSAAKGRLMLLSQFKTVNDKCYC
uniref:Reverse transcriptase domain-containing protein n=1 Tax=Tanacetum cinerariifolium TaxID=118510 RepID=A0A6L2LC28_TANCI|nr:hypothetical protein [Tanacetum cinerariifolium]